MESEWTKRGLGAHNRVTGIFTMNDMDLGKTSLVKHSIRLTDNNPFKKHYLQILPSMYEDVSEHLKVMLEIDAIWPFNSHGLSHSYWYVRKMVSSDFVLTSEN